MFRMYSKWMIERYHDDGDRQMPSWLVRAIERDPELQKHCADLNLLSVQLRAISIDSNAPSEASSQMDSLRIGLSQGAQGHSVVNSQSSLPKQSATSISNVAGLPTSRVNANRPVSRSNPHEWNRGLIAGVAFCSVLVLCLGVATYYSALGPTKNETLAENTDHNSTAGNTAGNSEKTKISGKQLVDSGVRLSKSVVSKWNNKRESMKSNTNSTVEDWSFSRAELATLGRSSLRFLVYRIPIAVIQVLGLNQTSSSPQKSSQPPADATQSTPQ